MTKALSKDLEFSRSITTTDFLINRGPFVFQICSSLSNIAKNIECFYPSGEVDILSTVFVDFRLSINALSPPKGWFLNQAEFHFDDQVIFNPFPYHHATAMLEWGMNWCISTQINTYLIIHAAVIEKSGFAAVLPAPPGSGKSTLCASLVQEGWRLLSDELTLINLTTAEAVPVPRPIGLKNQSIDIIKQRYPEAVFGVLSSDTLKGSVCHLKPPSESVKLQFEECPIGWIIFPKYEADADTELEAKSKGRAFMEIANNAFNYSVLGVEGFEILKKVVDRADCYSFKYSNLDEAIAVFEQLEAPREV